MKAIRAAGAVVTRQGARGLEVLIVHRKRWGDWSIPKGKANPGESAPATAVREIFEETGVTIRLGLGLDRIRYDTSKGPKIADYWGATPLSAVRRAPDDEVDVVSWLPIRVALARLSYDHDRGLVEQYLDQPATTPLIIVRHAKAMQRKHWVGTDPARPTDALGRRQAMRLVPLLDAFGIRHVLSSAANRCVQTVHPFAARHDLTVVRHVALTEDEGEKHPKDVLRLMRTILSDVGRLSQPTVVCGHRPVLPYMLDAVDLPNRPMKTAECAVVHLTTRRETQAVEWHRPIT